MNNERLTLEQIKEYRGENYEEAPEGKTYCIYCHAYVDDDDYNPGADKCVWCLRESLLTTAQYYERNKRKE